jgi:hypothetical protein
MYLSNLKDLLYIQLERPPSKRLPVSIVIRGDIVITGTVNGICTLLQAFHHALTVQANDVVESLKGRRCAIYNWLLCIECECHGQLTLAFSGAGASDLIEEDAF